jgi:hypothetical protein
VPPGWGETVAGAAERRRAVEGADAVRPVARWDAAAGAWVAIAELAAPPGSAAG